jgi:lysine 2,3-aminomutase
VISTVPDRFPGVRASDWGDWRWQQRNALRTAADLARVVRLTDDERRGVALAQGRFRLAVTPYYASLADPEHPHCPVRRQAIPVAAEADAAAGDLRDPLGEDAHRPVRAVVHKHPDRALLLVTDACPVYCRHCTRRRITAGASRPPAGDGEPGAEAAAGGAFDAAAVEQGVAYVAAHREIREVLVSGGDPLVLSDERLGRVLGALRAIPHVRVLRVGTRAPVTNPMRVTDALAALLRAHAPLFVVTHFNHPKECTAEAREACERLVDRGVPVENQTVLLRRVNSSPRALADLFQRLLEWRVRPYYLHQGDVAAGAAHFRTPLATGLAILEHLRANVSGLAIPHLAVDLPGGGGKVTLAPDWRDGRGEERGVPGDWFRGPRGGRWFHPDAPESDASCPYDEVFYG